MSENKQYITQALDTGNVMISEDVFATIVSHAVSEVDGVVGLDIKPGSDIAELIGKKNWGKGVKIIISDDGAISIDCNITVAYGHSVVDVAKAAQEAIYSAVQSMTGAIIATTNVNVCGIVRQ